MFLDKILLLIRKRKGIFLLILVVSAVFMAVVSFATKPSAPATPAAVSPTNPTPLSVSSDLTKNYTRLNEIIPGTSTFDDVKKINGAPQSVAAKGAKIYASYKTPIESYTNTVLIENNLVVYYIENVFGTYRGNVESYASSYGPPDLSLFEKDDSYSWYVYLKQGIAIKNDGKDIGAILHFIPQSKEGFMEIFGKELNLSNTPPAEE